MSKRERGAFTLIELLVVIVIISMLVALLLPSAISIRRAMQVHASRAAIAALDGACLAYQADFGEFPPSSDEVNFKGWYGSELLPLFLTGYGKDPDASGNENKPDGVPCSKSGTKLDQDDGVEGYGYRVMPRGRVYGPYNGAEKIKVAPRKAGRPPEFRDAFDNPILYYRAGQYKVPGNPDPVRYNADHNDVLEQKKLDWDTATVPVGSEEDIPYVKSVEKPPGDNRYTVGGYYRTDFVLFSAGPDGELVAQPGRFDPPGSTSWEPSDDITNFVLWKRRTE